MCTGHLFASLSALLVGLAGVACGNDLGSDPQGDGGESPTGAGGSESGGGRSGVTGGDASTGGAASGGNSTSQGGSGGGAGGTFEGTPLDHYASGGSAISFSEIGNNLSGNTYNPVTGTHLLILNNNKQIHELDGSLNHIRRIDLGGINGWDLEDIAYLGTVNGDHEYALVNENGTMWIGVVPDDGSVNLSLGGFQRITFAPPPAESNKGPEGVAYDAATQTLWACSERSPMIIYELARPSGTADVSYADGYPVTQPFDAESAFAGLITDISSCFFDDRTGRLLVLSHQSSMVLDVALDGTVHGQLALSGAPQFEGLTLGPNDDLILTSEPNLLQVYAFTPD